MMTTNKTVLPMDDNLTTPSLLPFLNSMIFEPLPLSDNEVAAPAAAPAAAAVAPPSPMMECNISGSINNHDDNINIYINNDGFTNLILNPTPINVKECEIVPEINPAMSILSSLPSSSSLSSLLSSRTTATTTTTNVDYFVRPHDLQDLLRPFLDLDTGDFHEISFLNMQNNTPESTTRAGLEGDVPSVMSRNSYCGNGQSLEVDRYAALTSTTTKNDTNNHFTGNQSSTLFSLPVSSPTGSFTSSSFSSSVSSSSTSSNDVRGANSEFGRMKQNMQWLERYRELCQFKKVHGHCSVPYNFKENRRLSQWVKRQRNQKMIKLQGRHSNLTNGREAMLNKLGFIWNAHKASWDALFFDLVQYKERHGHCNIPTRFPENPQLAIWVKLQRRRMRQVFDKKERQQNTIDEEGQEGSISSSSNLMDPERMTQLLRLGLEWDPKKYKGCS